MISIPARIYSKAIWETIRYRTQSFRDFFFMDNRETSSLAVSESTANMLRRLAFFFQPRCIAEIGTYIGRSTFAMADGMTGGVIHTCDSGEDVYKQPDTPNIEIKRYHCMSTEMLKQIDQPVGMFFFDGRIQPDDVELIQKLAASDCVFLFDDFEGIEKGVCNALMIQHLGGILVYPEDGSTLGMLLRTKLGFSRQ